MAIRKIVYLPHPALRAGTQDVTEFNDELQTLIDDMFETMYDARGVGLAAPQIALDFNLAVIDATQDKSQQLVLINPEIIAREGEETMQEGCLSVPGGFDTVTRAAKVTMRALDRHGKEYELSAEGLLAEAIQHEIDHLHGKLYIDLLSPLKRDRAKKRLEKFKRMQKG